MKRNDGKQNRNETRIRRPIKRTLLILSVFVIVVLCGLTTLLSYLFVSSIIEKDNSERLTDIVSYIETRVDADDLKACRDTGVKSAKYVELQAFLNEFIDEFDIVYLYIVVPTKTELVNVISATSQEERDAGEDDLELGEISDAYTEEELKPYCDLYGKKEIGFFEESSDWGTYFTACKTLFDSNGEKVALICADRDINAIRRRTAMMVVTVAGSVLAAITIFALVVRFLFRKNVTGPLFDLEENARSFASDVKNGSEIMKTDYVSPEIKTGNEVESLADAIEYMATSLKESAQKSIDAAREYARNLYAAREQADSDALTGVKNKHAYIDLEGQINQTIEEGNPKPFAVVIFDINGLKRVNDTEGHVAGDDFIRSACKLICDVFKHSPVFRVGGDEFAVIAEDEDYVDIEERVEEVEKRNQKNRESGQATVACGFARYDGETDVMSVFKKADARMYENKRKAER